MGLLAIAEGDTVSLATTENLCTQGADSNLNNMDMATHMKIVLKSVGIGFTINRMKFHPSNDALLGRCLVVIYLV